jgi:uncharacterized phage protein gp47/JayE
MSFDRPTLTELIARIKADIESRLEGADASLRRTLLAILATVEAGAVHGLYGYMSWIAAQVMPDTAEAEQLDRWGSIWGKRRKRPSTASGVIACEGADGSVIPEGTIWTRADGVEFETMVEGSIVGGKADVDVEAVGAGEIGNTDEGTKLSLSTSVEGIKSMATAGELSGGADEESDADLRSRVLSRIRQAPHGGADFDYEAWALEIGGVTRVWVYPREMGAGTVTVRIMTDDTTENGIPDESTLASAQAYLDGQRPVTAEVYVVAPIPDPLDMEINLAPNTAAVRAAVQEEVTAVILAESVPGGATLLSHLREAISVATGETDHVLVSPTADVEHEVGHIAVPGTITFGGLS